MQFNQINSLMEEQSWLWKGRVIFESKKHIKKAGGKLPGCMFSYFYGVYFKNNANALIRFDDFGMECFIIPGSDRKKIYSF